MVASAAHQPAAAPAGTRLAWVLLDWAASAFSTVLITLVVTYSDKVVFADRPWGVAPGVVWAWTMAAAMLAAAVAGPWVAAWADRLSYFFEHPEEVARREADIRARFVPTPWSETARVVLRSAVQR